MATRDDQVGVDDPSQAVCQARNVVIEPVAIRQQNPVDIPDELLVCLHCFEETLRTRFFLSFYKKHYIAAKCFLLG